MFQEFKAGLERDIVWEEAILFPSFENKTGMTEGPTKIMRSKHQQIRGILEAIAGKLIAGTDATGDDETGLLALLGSHNQKEESTPYPMIDQVTDGEERTKIFAEMARHQSIVARLYVCPPPHSSQEFWVETTGTNHEHPHA